MLVLVHRVLVKTVAWYNKKSCRSFNHFGNVVRYIFLEGRAYVIE